MIKPGVSKTDYSKIARYYDKLRPGPIDIWGSKIIEYGKIDPNCLILDVGCGTGRFPIYIRRAKNSFVCALEPSIDMLKQAITKDRSKDIRWIRGDAQKLPFQDDSFNCVYMTLVIHHIASKEMALLEIYRVLKQDGRCVIMTSSHNRIRKSVLHYFPGINAIDLRRFPAVPSLKRSMKKIGFKDVHYHVVKQHEEDVPTVKYLEKVRDKYISTLTLLGKEAFQKGFKIFQKKVCREYGDRLRRTVGFVFVVGAK